VRTQSTTKSQREFAAKYPLCDAVLHPDQSELATVDERGCLRVWALAGKECLFEAVPKVSSSLPVSLQSVSYAPDGSMIACCNAEVPKKEINRYREMFLFTGNKMANTYQFIPFSRIIHMSRELHLVQTEKLYAPVQLMVLQSSSV
jgi:hypothetical protein